MKKRSLSIFMALVMSVSLLPMAVYAGEDHDRSAEGAQILGEGYAAPESEPEVMAVQAMISALPTLQNVTAEDYDAVQDAYDAYAALTEARQAQIEGAEIFEALFAWFNEQTMPLAACPPHVVTTPYGTCDLCYQPVPHEADYTWYADPSAKEFILNDAKQLKAFANIVNGTDLPSGITQTGFSGKIIKLGSDIDLKVTGSVEYIPNWTPIGKAAAAFEGTFDGGNHSIINLISQSYSGYAGLFGYASNRAILRDIIVEGTAEGEIAGGIIAEVSGSVDGKGNPEARITGCIFRGSVGGSEKAGGIAGSTAHCTIEKCANYAAINATNTDAAAGGIVGYAANALLLKNCYNQGSIRDGGFDMYIIGGLVGCIGSDSQNYIKHIERCYNIGTVTSEMGKKGALVGEFENGTDNTATMSCCYHLSGTTAAFGTAAPADCIAVSISENQFKSGEIAWSLQDYTQKEMIWGQRLGGADPDAYPIFSKNTVYQVKFMDRSGISSYDAFTEYLNSGDTIDALPTPNPAPSGFAGWNTEKDNGGTRFTASTQITKNTTLYAHARGTMQFIVAMEAYVAGGTPSTPSISPDTAGAAVTYYYNRIASNTGGTQWDPSAPPSLISGTYYMYAYIGESEAYEAYTTDAVAFTVAEAAVCVTADGRKNYYAGFEEALAAANAASGDAVEIALLADCTASAAQTVSRSMTLEWNGKRLAIAGGALSISGSGTVVTMQNSGAGAMSNVDADLYVFDGAKVKIMGGGYKSLQIGCDPNQRISAGSGELSGGTYSNGIAYFSADAEIWALLSENYGYQTDFGWERTENAVRFGGAGRAVAVKQMPMKGVDIQIRIASALHDASKPYTISSGNAAQLTLEAAPIYHGSGNGSAAAMQWYTVANGVPTEIPGAAESTYTLPANLPAGTYQYTCAVKMDGCLQWGAAATIIVEQSNAAAGGGNGSGGNKAESTTLISSDKGDARLQIAVRRDTAAVDIADGQIERILADGAGVVTLDVAGLENVKNINIPADIVERINAAEDTTLSVALADGSLELDETALDSISGERDITISMQKRSTADLTDTQQRAVGDLEKIGFVIDVELYAGKEKQSAFRGGILTISVPYALQSGENINGLKAWFIREDGTLEYKGGYYHAEKGCFIFETKHLSRYLLMRMDAEAGDIAESADAGFADISADQYYAKAVAWAAENGIAGGITETLFAPDQACTRAQIVSFLWRAAGRPEPAAKENPFADLCPEAYYYQAVLWAAERGIAAGISEDAFHPDASCTRAQAMAFLYRNAKANGGDADAQELRMPFTDVPEWCYEAVAWGYINGITSGVGEAAFLPNGACSRAQIVTLLYRAR